MEKMAQIMDTLRQNPPKTIGDFIVTAVSDYKTSKITFTDGKEEKIELPKSNVLAFALENGNKVIVRPSGTEPKIKFYFGVKAPLASVADFDEVQAELDAKIEGIKRDLKLE